MMIFKLRLVPTKIFFVFSFSFHTPRLHLKLKQIPGTYIYLQRCQEIHKNPDSDFFNFIGLEWTQGADMSMPLIGLKILLKKTYESLTKKKSVFDCILAYVFPRTILNMCCYPTWGNKCFSKDITSAQVCKHHFSNPFIFIFVCFQSTFYTLHYILSLVGAERENKGRNLAFRTSFYLSAFS